MIVAGTIILERTNPLVYLIWSTIYVWIIFPLGVNWGWNQEGWLRGLGFFDFAGGAVVHIAGAASGLGAILLVGDRKNRFDSKFLEERPNEFRPTSTTHIGLWIFVLWFTWFSFCPGNLEKAVSTDLTDHSTIIGQAAINNILGSSCAWVFMLSFNYFIQDRLDFTRLTNSILAGLIAVSAGGSHYERGWVACIIWTLGAVAYLCYSLLNERKFKLDDPRDAVALHFGAGSLGLIAISFFHRTHGLFYTEGDTRWELVGANFLGLLIYTALPLISTYVLFLFFRIIGLVDKYSLVEEHGNDNLRVGWPGCMLDKNSSKVYHDLLMSKQS